VLCVYFVLDWCGFHRWHSTLVVFKFNNQKITQKSTLNKRQCLFKVVFGVIFCLLNLNVTKVQSNFVVACRPQAALLHINLSLCAYINALTLSLSFSVSLSLSLSLALSLFLSLCLSHTHKHTLEHKHAHIHTHTHPARIIKVSIPWLSGSLLKHDTVCTRTHLNTHIRTHVHTHTPTHTHICAHTLTHTNTLIHTRTHTHTHTQAVTVRHFAQERYGIACECVWTCHAHACKRAHPQVYLHGHTMYI